MSRTFLYAIDAGDTQIALKFESSTPKTFEFMVTFLTAPHVDPFTMVLDKDKWQLPDELPHEVKALETELLAAAKKFQR